MTETPSKRLHVGLWATQVALALAFGAAGAMKLFTPMDELASTLSWVGESPATVVRFIGAAELAGAIGLVLPWALNVRPRLTPAAAWALCGVMALASVHHLARGEVAMLVPPFVLGGLSVFVAWGRRAQV